MSKSTTPSKNTESRASILGAITNRTKLIAFIAIVIEALFLVAAYKIPETQRIIAFGICALVLVIALVGCIWLELSETRSRPAPQESLGIPTALEHSVILIDPRTQTDKGVAADIYRTATRCKFAGEFEEAIKHCKRVIEIDPQHWKARYNVGSCLLYLDRLKESEAHFKRLLEDFDNSPPNPDPIYRELWHGCYIQLNDICDKRADYATGKSYLLRSLHVKPDDALSYINLAISAVKAKNHSEALKWYQIVLEHPEQLQVLSSISPEDKSHLDKIQNKQKTKP